MNVGGVGYKVFLSKKSLSLLKKGEISLFCHTNSKKDSWEIFGFFTPTELELFEFLIKLSGIGPRTALEASSIGSLDKLREGVKKNDPILMEELFALGQRKAQAIIFEISRKITNKKKVSKEDQEAIKALAKLGFSQAEAKEAVLSLSDSVSGVEAKIKEALKLK